MTNDDTPRPRPGASEQPLPPGGGAGEELETGGGEPEAPQAELVELRDRYLRLSADFENFRRRRTQELADRARYSSEEAVRALLPVLDNLSRAVAQAPPDTDRGFLDGVAMVLRQLREALAGLGVHPVPGAGEPFDPAVHEAISGEESPDVDRETVVDVLQEGHLLHDRLLRPALVRVAHPAAPAPAARRSARTPGPRGGAGTDG